MNSSHIIALFSLIVLFGVANVQAAITCTPVLSGYQIRNDQGETRILDCSVPDSTDIWSWPLTNNIANITVSPSFYGFTSDVGSPTINANLCSVQQEYVLGVNRPPRYGTYVQTSFQNRQSDGTVDNFAFSADWGTVAAYVQLLGCPCIGSCE